VSDLSDNLEAAVPAEVPHSARIWNYWMGGKDNFEIDRIVGDKSLDIDPDIATMAVESRRFLIRTVRYVASSCGVRQFLDVGTGLPTMQNTHEVAQTVAPNSKVVYVDNDPLVLAHARALLKNTTDEGVTGYIDSDFHKPEQIVADARYMLNFARPIAVMFMGVLGHAHSYDDMRRIVSVVMDAVPSDSYLIFWDGTTDSRAYVTLCQEYAKTGGAPYAPRPSEQLRSVFDDFELVDPPGFVPITDWRVNDDEVDFDTTVADNADESRPISAYGGVARKP
jgi:hypothetical protein